MAVTVKKITLWRREVDHKPGMLSLTLAPLAEAGADLQVVMGYRYGKGKAAIEVFPVKTRRQAAAAMSGGLRESEIPALLVTGDNRPGLGHAMAEAVAGGGININFLVTQVIGDRFSSVVGFDSEADADRATPLIKKARPRSR